MIDNYGINTGCMIVHMPHDTSIKREIATKEDVRKYIKDTSGIIAYGLKKERIQQATNMKSIIFWLMDELRMQPQTEE